MLVAESLLVPAAVLAPNLVWFALPPRDAPAEPPRAPIALRVAEHAGRVATMALPVLARVHTDGGVHRAALAVMALALAGYYACWARYFARGRRFALLWAPLIGVPIPMAILPMAYFAAAAVAMDAWWLGAATAVFAVGHVTLSARVARGVARGT